MSSEEDNFAGYETSEVSPVKDRSRSLSSVIFKLANAWNIIPESPEKLMQSCSAPEKDTSSATDTDTCENIDAELDTEDEPRTSIAQRRGSLDTIKRDRLSSRSKSVDDGILGAAQKTNQDKSLVEVESLKCEEFGENVDSSETKAETETEAEAKAEKVACSVTSPEVVGSRRSSLLIGKVGSQQDGISELPGTVNEEKQDSEESPEEKDVPKDDLQDKTKDDLEHSVNLGKKVTVRLQRLSSTKEPEEEKHTDDSMQLQKILEKVSDSTKEEFEETEVDKPVLRRSSARGKKPQDAEPSSDQPEHVNEPEDKPVRETRQRGRSLPETETPGSSLKEGRTTRSTLESTPDILERKKVGDKLGRAAKKPEDIAPKGRLTRRTDDESPQSRMAKRTSDDSPKGRLTKRTADDASNGRLAKRTEDDVPQGRLTKRTAADASKGRVTDTDESPESHLTKRSDDDVSKSQLTKGNDRDSDDDDNNAPQGRLTRKTDADAPQGRLTKRTAVAGSQDRLAKGNDGNSDDDDNNAPQGRLTRKTDADAPQGRLTKRTADDGSQDRLTKGTNDDAPQGRIVKRTGDSTVARPTRRSETKPPEGRSTRSARDTSPDAGTSSAVGSSEEVPEKKSSRLSQENTDLKPELKPRSEKEGKERSRSRITDSDEPRTTRRSLETSTEARKTRSNQDGEAEGRFTRSGNEIKPASLVQEKKSKLEEKKPANCSPKKGDGVVVNLVMKKKKKRLLEKGQLTEADVIRRVHDLKAKGLWSEKKIPKCVVEQKTKVHWDFVLEEMTWLADVVQKELKIKKANAKRCSTMVQKFFKDKELNAARAEKAREANLRKIALNCSREIKTFWGNAQKLFEWRVKQKLERKRKEALDQHLNFIVDKTEKYSTLLAESLAESASGQVSRAESVCSGETEGEQAADLEYNPDSASSDDEETIDHEEKQEHHEPEKELQELEQGAEVPIEELLRKYYPEQFSEQKEENIEPKTEEEDVEPKKEEAVDSLKEDAVKPKTGDAVEPKKEDGESKLEVTEEVVGKRRRKPIDFAEVEKKILEEEKKMLEKKNNEPETEIKEEEKKPSEGKDESSDEDDKDPGIKSLVAEEDKLEEYASMASKFQPTGNTLETTTVKTRVPYLLKHTLREYQHIGLDWMVSLYERGLNGILADEMGLGKTIQTIALLAHMAVDRQNWGPHLIVVPTSVMLNWEMEIKKWCPGFKVMVYFGSQKERRLKRVGWTKPNAFHICITSYKLVIQDHSSFRRFKWQYFILDEAQHIKNFKSQRWQLLLNFASVGRLLLTGTPLQNNLMELWSLMHFLMPHVFESHRDFKEWFSNPMTGMVEGNSEYNDGLIKRLHKVLRPFLLRRLKCEVEKQLPKKYEHLVKCPLSKRQRFLYDDFMSRAKTKETLSSGNLLSVINILMQLRKCCNHPNLFEPRATLSPFIMPSVELKLPKLLFDCLEYNVLNEIDLSSTPLLMAYHENSIDPYTSFRATSLKCSSRRMLHPPATKAKFMCPTEKMRFEVKTQNPPLPKEEIEYHSPVLHLQQTGIGHVIPARNLSSRDLWLWKDQHKLKAPSGYFQIARVPKADIPVQSQVDNEKDTPTWSPPKKVIKLETRKIEEVTKEEGSTDPEPEMKRKMPRQEIKRCAKGIFNLSIFASEKMTLAAKSPNKAKKRRLQAKARESELYLESYSSKKDTYLINRRQRNLKLNNRRCGFLPLYGKELVETLEKVCLVPQEALRSGLEQLTCPVKLDQYKEVFSCYNNFKLVEKLDDIVHRMVPIFNNFIIHVPKTWTSARIEVNLDDDSQVKQFPGQFLISRFQVQVPDTRLIQYDCGKLQVLSSLLRTLHIGGHRALIFTQMTKMLDILESFLNYHGYVYMRLDGSTKVEMRQSLMERFNNNSKYFIFILSTRSGGVGINLTGADTVIFYDSDWNPTMDAQAQDRCHRIGQTRDVHIYRLISERTVEENILKKANQKRLLGDLAIEGGNFTTSFFKKQTIHDLFEETASATNEDLKEEPESEAPKKAVGAVELALATAEDDTDRQATKVARAEENQDEQDFNEQTDEDRFQAILAELSKVEVYAIHHLERQEEDWVQGQLDAAQAEIEARKEEFDAEKLDELTQEIREEMGEESTDEEKSEASDEMDYAPDESDSDDEDTIAKDEKEVDEKNNDNEINMLENDAEVPLEELIKQYYPDQYKEMDLDIQLDLMDEDQVVSHDMFDFVSHVEENGVSELEEQKEVTERKQEGADEELVLELVDEKSGDIPAEIEQSFEATTVELNGSEIDPSLELQLENSGDTDVVDTADDNNVLPYESL